MSVHCRVFIDGSHTGEDYTFASTPRAGDRIQVARLNDPQLLTVVSVMHVAKGVYEEAPEAHVQLNVSSARTAKTVEG